MKIKRRWFLLAVVGVILAGLVGEARAELPVWLKKSKPGKFMIDTVDRSYLDIAKLITYHKYTSQYYYRSEWKPTYTGETYNYSIAWYVQQRWAPSYKTNLAYLSFTYNFTPQQYAVDLWWGPDAYVTKNHSLSLDAYWKIYQQWSLRTYFHSYQNVQEWNRERMKQFKHNSQGGGGTVTNPYYDETEEQWTARTSTYGVYNLYDYNQKYNIIGIGLRWYGKAY